MTHQKIRKPKKFQQNTQAVEHFHPRGLARQIARNQLTVDGYSNLNRPPKKTKDLGTHSTFSRMWREAATYAMSYKPKNGRVQREKATRRLRLGKAGANG